MLTIQFIRDNQQKVVELLKIKNFHRPELIDRLLELDDRRRSLQVKTNGLQAELNQVSKEIGLLFKQGEKEKAAEAKNRTTAIKGEVEASEKELQQAIGEK